MEIYFVKEKKNDTWREMMVNETWLFLWGIMFPNPAPGNTAPLYVSVEQLYSIM